LEQFSQPSLYFNTFFLINTKIVPGSSIIQAILDSLKTSRPQIRFEADYSKPPANSTWPTSPPTSAYNAAQLAGVNYEITLNISNILRLAYNRADDI
jgi:hypothetical protein